MKKTNIFAQNDSGKYVESVANCLSGFRIHTKCREAIWSWVRKQWPPPRLSDIVAEYGEDRNELLRKCLTSGFLGVVMTGVTYDTETNMMVLDDDDDPWVYMTNEQEKYINELD